MSHKYELDYIEPGCSATYVNEKTGDQKNVEVEAEIANQCHWRGLLYICKDYETDNFFHRRRTTT